MIARVSLLLLAIAMLSLWLLSNPHTATPEEQWLWERVRAAQMHLSEWRKKNGTQTLAEHDPWACGLIGLEWSGITTTLGDLEAKRTACNPAWAIQFTRWFEKLGLKAGDHVAVYSSASFPGLLLNAINAAEAMQLEPLLIVSLGSSTWGANHPDAPWPVLATELRRAGFINNKADFFTLGAGAELGHGLTLEYEALLRKAASETDTGLLTATDLESMVRLKTELLTAHQSRLLINIGGSQANLGDDDEILRLSRGLVPANEKDRAGNGVIAHAMQNDIPVIHMLNIKSISSMVGIPYDSPPRLTAPTRASTWWSGAGLILFFAVLAVHRRWRLERAENGNPPV